MTIIVPRMQVTLIFLCCTKSRIYETGRVTPLDWYTPYKKGRPSSSWSYRFMSGKSPRFITRLKCPRYHSLKNFQLWMSWWTRTISGTVNSMRSIFDCSQTYSVLLYHTQNSFLKPLYTFGKQYCPSSILRVSQLIYKIINLWSFRLNRPSETGENNGKTHSFFRTFRHVMTCVQNKSVTRYRELILF